MKEEDARTSGQVQLSAATLGQCSPKGERPVRKRTMRWVKWHRKKEQCQLVKAAGEVLNAVKHDTSQLMVVSAVIDGRRCKDVLIDPGASSNFVRRRMGRVEWGYTMKKLTTPLDVTLADGKVGAKSDTRGAGQLSTPHRGQRRHVHTHRHGTSCLMRSSSAYRG